MRENAVVTGIGIVSPLRPFEDLDSFWHALCSGEDSIKRMKPPLLDLKEEWPMAAISTSSFPGVLKPEDKADFIVKKALLMALTGSAREIQSLVPDFRIGITVGTVLGNILSKEKKMIESDTANDCLSDIADGIASQYSLNGPVITVSTACASGTDALGIAKRKIENDQADIMLAGGVDVLSDFAISGFNSLQAITKDRVRPFDRNRDGLALGEGAAFVVLESESRARKRGARIYAKIAGYAARSDANHLTGPHREGRGLADAMKHALADAKISNAEVDYINVHGTGTRYNDLMETKAIKRVFGESAYNKSISSTKSMLGHSFGAAGVIEAICCILSMNNGIIPPTINYLEKDPECDLNCTPNVAVERKVRTSISLSAGFGGQNSVIVLTKS